MSTILGIFNRDGEPVSPETIRGMMEAMAHWGPAGKGIWNREQVGMGRMRLNPVPKNEIDNFPIKSPCGRYAITAAARLDNRNELCDSLRISAFDGSSLSDSALILRAYLKWGEKSPDFLLGDWSFAIWDQVQQKLFIARDHHGNTGLYYYYSPRCLVFSSCLKGILAQSRIPAVLNSMRVAQILTSWPGDGFSTVYRNIFRLPPAHCMTVSREKLEVRRYWRLENTPALKLASDQDYVDAFLEVFREAVACRIRDTGSAGVLLSGGLDSGSVAAIAARELRKEGRNIHAFSSVPRFKTEGLTRKNEIGDETPFIKSVADSWDNLELHLNQAQHVTPLQGIRRSLSLHGEPGHAASNAYWIMALMQEAQNLNIRTILTGEGGNGTISWHGAGHLAGLARALRWKRLRTELHNWRRQRDIPFFRAVSGQVVKPLIPLSLRDKIHRIRKGRFPWSDYSALREEMAVQLDIGGGMAAEDHDPAFGITRDTRRNRYELIDPGKQITGCLSHELGSGFGIRVLDPTNDKRVLEFCLSLPDDQYFHNGVDRLLIRRAAAGLLPEPVRWNVQRGCQAADVGSRILDSRSEIQTALKELRRCDLVKQFIDLKKMETVLGRLESGVNADSSMQAKTILLRGLMAGLFLFGFAESSSYEARPLKSLPPPGLLAVS